MFEKTWRPRVVDALDDVEAVDAAEVEPAADGNTLALADATASVEACAAGAVVDPCATGAAVEPAGTGAANMRMNDEKNMMSDWKSAAGLALFARGVSGVGLSGRALNWQVAFSSRSVGKISFVKPISTL